MTGTYSALFNQLLHATGHACNNKSADAAELFNLNLEFALTKLTLADLQLNKANRLTP